MALFTASNGKYKILSPKIDIVFKLLFGDNRNIDLLTDFLQSVLDLPSDEYAEINLIDPHLKRESQYDKLGIVDVRLKTKNGKIINIEIQIVEQVEMPERATYYNAKSLTTQINAGDDYSVLKKVITIVIADFEMVKNSPQYHHRFQLYDKSTGSKFTDIIEIDTLELTKIPKESDHTKRYQWLQFLRSEKEEDFEMIAEKDPVISKAVVKLVELSADEEAQLLYEAREKALRDERARYRTAMIKGLEEGRTKGLAEGLAEGRVEGRAAVAKNMLDLNFSPDQISAITGLSIEEIGHLK